LNTTYRSGEFERIREKSKLRARRYFRVTSGFICLKRLSIVNKYGEVKNNTWDSKRNLNNFKTKEPPENSTIVYITIEMNKISFVESCL